MTNGELIEISSKYGEFSYKSSYVEHGRIRYLCECSVCGKDCVYNRKMNTKPVCFSCQNSRNKKMEKERKKTEYQKGRADAIKEIKEWMLDDNNKEDDWLQIKDILWWLETVELKENTNE